MNFNKLCNDCLKSDKKIRFAGVLDSRGNLVAQKSRSDSSSLLSNEELRMLVYYTSDRRNRLQNLQHKLGEVKETITKFENVTTIILILDKNLFLISADPNSNSSKITSNLWKIIEKKPVKRKPTSSEIKKHKENQKMRIRTSKSARRSGKINKKEGKVNKSKQRTKTPRSQRKIATVRKSRH